MFFRLYERGREERIRFSKKVREELSTYIDITGEREKSLQIKKSVANENLQQIYSRY